MKQLTLDETAKQYADYAVSIAEQMGIILDYSNESIEKLEDLLDQFHKQAQKESISEQQYNEKGFMFGCYAGCTFIRNLKEGTWEIEPINQAVAVKVRSTYIFFPAKAYRRLKNGPEDNIIALYLTDYNKYADNPISLKIFR